MKVNKVELFRINLPLRNPFKVSFGVIANRDFFLVKIETADGFVGYGECSAFHEPSYLSDFTSGEYLVAKDFLVPMFVGHEIADPFEMKIQMSAIKGHNFVKMAFESAFWHIEAQKKNKSLAELFGGIREKIEIGESIGIKESISETIEAVAYALEKGYKRIKVKIGKNWDLEITKAIREKFPNIKLMLDGNSDYRKPDFDLLMKLDEFDLMMLEQPLAHDDIIDHADLQKLMSTPICLDESILTVEDARKALYLGATKIINIKPGRVGGPLESMAIHDLCFKSGVPVWCGGLFESGIGRAFNIALAAKEGFSMPADMTETTESFFEDLVLDPYEIINGEISVRKKAGLGFEINEKAINKYKTLHETFS
jgi:O-succinylbenzoate synthase